MRSSDELKNVTTRDKEVIYSEDLTPVIDRLVHVDHWLKVEAEKAVGQYRNYLFLRLKYPQYDLPPSREIDDVWHAHILHTEDYRNFCKKVFFNENDKYLDHHPHLTREGSIAKLQELFSRTQELYKKEFGEYIYSVRSSLFISTLANLMITVKKLLQRIYNNKALSFKIGGQ